MQVAHPHQALSDVGCLQSRALGRRMGGEIARYGDKHASTRIDVPHSLNCRTPASSI